MALVDVSTGQQLYNYGGKTRVYLPGHDDAFLEDFAAERIPTETMGLYKWRNRYRPHMHATDERRIYILHTPEE
jgi:hypothetical protein